MGIIVEQVDYSNNRWSFLCDSSPQMTPFNYPDYLSAVGFSSVNFIAEEKGNVLAGLSIPIRKSDQKMISVPYAPYHGLLFPDHADVPLYNRYKKNLEAASVLLEEVCNRYRDVCFSNHWSIKDMRPFSWYNYHTPENGTFQIDVAYTAVKALSSLESVMSGVSSGRKYDYKYSRNKYNLRCVQEVCEDDLDDFYQLYYLTFNRQNIELEESEIGQVKKIAQTVLKNGYGCLQYAELPSGERISAQLIIYDHRCAYYLFGANHPEYRNYGGGTFLLIEAMNKAVGMGIDKFDFVGVNSPMRGDFKLSFGAELMPYYCNRLTR
jgi:hypothetical protein